MKIEIKKVTGKESLKIWVNWLNNKKIQHTQIENL